jgi:hypothetical protein
MNKLEMSAWLRTTRKQHIADNFRLDPLIRCGRNDQVMVKIFKRYLVWLQHTTIEDERDDEQPS